MKRFLVLLIIAVFVVSCGKDDNTPTNQGQPRQLPSPYGQWSSNDVAAFMKGCTDGDNTLQPADVKDLGHRGATYDPAPQSVLGVTEQDPHPSGGEAAHLRQIHRHRPGPRTQPVQERVEHRRGGEVDITGDHNVPRRAFCDRQPFGPHHSRRIGMPERIVHADHLLAGAGTGRRRLGSPDER